MLADLDRLTYIDVEKDGKRFRFRSTTPSCASKVLQATGVAVPPTRAPALPTSRLMTSAPFDRLFHSRSANTFPCQRSPLIRRYFVILTVEDELSTRKNLPASSSLRVGKARVEPVGDELDARDEVVDVSVAAGAGLRRLNETVQQSLPTVRS